MAGTARYCPYCGATSPSWYNVCQRCHRALPAGGIASPRSTPPSSDPLAGRRFGFVGPLGALFGGTGLLWVSLGIALSIVGIFLVAVANLVNLAVSAANPSCAANTVCTASSGFYIAFVVAGVLTLVLGLAFGWYGLHRSLSRSSWLTLPP